MWDLPKKRQDQDLQPDHANQFSIIQCEESKTPMQVPKQTGTSFQIHQKTRSGRSSISHQSVYCCSSSTRTLMFKDVESLIRRLSGRLWLCMNSRCARLGE